MKKFIYILSIFGLITLTSCEKTSEDPSKITYFIIFEMNGDATMHVPIGSTFTDPGVKAMEGETDVTSSVSITNPVNINKAGFYTISYSVANVDGLKNTITRTVIVYDPDFSTDISGTYTVADGTHRFAEATGVITPYSGYSINITTFLPGIFYVSDFFGGYYDQRAEYGATYAMTGYITLNNDNSMELQSSFVRGWGDSLSSFKNGVYDPETGIVSFDAGYVNAYIFSVILTK